MGGMAVRPAHQPGVCEIKDLFDPDNRFNPGQDRAAAEDGRQAQFPLSRRATEPNSASSRRWTGRHGTCGATR
jgi:hypothetical protein